MDDGEEDINIEAPGEPGRLMKWSYIFAMIFF